MEDKNKINGQRLEFGNLDQIAWIKAKQKEKEEYDKLANEYDTDTDVNCQCYAECTAEVEWLCPICNTYNSCVLNETSNHITLKHCRNSKCFARFNIELLDIEEAIVTMLKFNKCPD